MQHACDDDVCESAYWPRSFGFSTLNLIPREKANKKKNNTGGDTPCGMNLFSIDPQSRIFGAHKPNNGKKIN